MHGDTCALETKRRFVTEQGGKKKQSRNLNPGLTAWVTRSSAVAIGADGAPFGKDDTATGIIVTSRWYETNNTCNVTVEHDDNIKSLRVLSQFPVWTEFVCN